MSALRCNSILASSIVPITTVMVVGIRSPMTNMSPWGYVMSWFLYHKQSSRLSSTESKRFQSGRILQAKAFGGTYCRKKKPPPLLCNKHKTVGQWRYVVLKIFSFFLSSGPRVTHEAPYPPATRMIGYARYNGLHERLKVETEQDGRCSACWYYHGRARGSQTAARSLGLAYANVNLDDGWCFQLGFHRQPEMAIHWLRKGLDETWKCKTATHTNLKIKTGPWWRHWSFHDDNNCRRSCLSWPFPSCSLRSPCVSGFLTKSRLPHKCFVKHK